jgi:hypothetical protein
MSGDTKLSPDCVPRGVFRRRCPVAGSVSIKGSCQNRACFRHQSYGGVWRLSKAESSMATRAIAAKERELLHVLHAPVDVVGPAQLARHGPFEDEADRPPHRQHVRVLDRRILAVVGAVGEQERFLSTDPTSGSGGPCYRRTLGRCGRVRPASGALRGRMLAANLWRVLPYINTSSTLRASVRQHAWH